MKKSRISALILAFFFMTVPLILVHAQTSLAGDEICGATTTTECTIFDAVSIIKKTTLLIVGFAMLAGVVSIGILVLVGWKDAAEGKPFELKEIIKKIKNVAIGILLITLSGVGFYTLLNYLGITQQQNFDPLRVLKLLSEGLIPHAYAQAQYLPNATPYNDLYALALGILRLIIRFILYPVIVILWAVTGFSFVFAQGAPDKLVKAKKLLLIGFFSTLVVFMFQGFLIALQATVNTILNG